MLKRGRIESALKHIDKLNLTDQFDVEDLFQKLSAKNDFPPILRFAGRYNLIGKFPVKLLVQKMLDNAQWKEAWKTVQMKGLTKIFPLHTIVEKAASAGNFSIVAQFIEDHSLAPRMSKTLDEFENKLMNQIVQFEKIEEEKEKTKSQVHRDGLRWKDYKIRMIIRMITVEIRKIRKVRRRIMVKINQNQPSSPKTGKPSIKPIMTIEYPAPPTKNRALLEHVVKQMIDQHQWYFAMKYALDYNLATVFPPVEIIQKMIDDEEYSLALRYIVGLGEYDQSIAEIFFPMLPFIREERASKRIQFLSKGYNKKNNKDNNYNNTGSESLDDLVPLEKVLSIDTKEIKGKDVNGEKGNSAIENDKNKRLSPSSSLMNILKKGSNATNSIISSNNSNNNNGVALSRSMMLKASLDAFDDSMALHEEESPAGSPDEKSPLFMVAAMEKKGNDVVAEEKSQFMVSATLEKPINNTTFKSENSNKAPSQAKSRFSHIFNDIDNHNDDDDDDDSDDEEEIVLLSPGRQSSRFKFASNNNNINSNNNDGAINRKSNLNRIPAAPLQLPGPPSSLNGMSQQKPNSQVPPSGRQLQNASATTTTASATTTTITAKPTTIYAPWS